MLRVTSRITMFIGLVILLTMGLHGTLVLRAQATPTKLKFGQTVRSDITAQKLEVNYTFEGKADEVVIVRMQQNGETGGLKTPAFTVLNGKTKLIDSTKVFTLSQTIGYAVFRLPEDATYTLVASRRGGKAGKDTGKYSLTIYNAPLLEVGDTVDEQTNDSNEKYYSIEPDESFIITYGKKGGTFSPMIAISAVRANGNFEQVAEMSGKSLEIAALSVTPERNVVYIIQITKAFLSNSKGNVEYSMRYTLRR